MNRLRSILRNESAVQQNALPQHSSHIIITFLSFGAPDHTREKSGHNKQDMYYVYVLLLKSIMKQNSDIYMYLNQIKYYKQKTCL